MNILIISQFYYPEMGAPAIRFYDFAKFWHENGHSITVLTAFPNFPNGVIDRKYKRKLKLSEKINEVNVIRTYIWASPKLRHFDKALGYITFALSSSIYLLLNRTKYDVTIVTSPPPFVYIPAIIVQKIKRIPFVFDVRDFWPENLVNSERLSNPFLIKIMTKLEEKAYSNASLITVVTKGKKDVLLKKITKNQIEIISNGVDINSFNTKKVTDENIDDFINKYDSCFIYAGVFNPPQGLDIIIKAVKDLTKTIKGKNKFGVILIGDGSEKNKLIQEITDSKIENIHLVGIKPKHVVFHALRKARAIIIPLKKRRDLHTIPSKIYESLASQRPILLSAAGESVDIIKNANAGMISEPEDYHALAENMKLYIEDEKLANTHGLNGYKYCKQNFDIEEISLKFLKLLQSINNQNRE